ncbi:hypothetical protein RYX36_004669 [Vicia faba]
MVVVGYYGKNSFEVVAFKEINRLEDLPNSHSRFINQKGIYVSDVELTMFNVSTRKLELQAEFACVLQANDYEVLALCEANESSEMVSILNPKDQNCTKLGYEWDEFCKSNHFKGGEAIRFRLDVTDENKTCHMYKGRNRVINYYSHR